MATVYKLVSYSQVLTKTDSYVPGDVFGESNLIATYDTLSAAKVDFDISYRTMEIEETSRSNELKVTYYAIEYYNVDENGNEEYVDSEEVSEDIQIAFDVSDYNRYDDLVNEVAKQCDCDNDEAIHLICDAPKYIDLNGKFQEEDPYWIARFVKDNM